MNEVVCAGRRALDRDKAGLDVLLRAKVAAALADSRPLIPIDEAFEQIRAATRRA